MALTLLAANNAQTVLAAGINATATTLTVNTGTGNLFPSPVSGTSFFKLTLVDSATGSLSEIVHVTSRTGDTMTINRAQEGTTARIWSANDIAANMMTAGTLSYILGNFQPLDPTLTALAALVGVANKLPYFNGDDTAALTDLTQVGRDIIGKSTIADILTYLGLGTAATSDVSDYTPAGQAYTKAESNGLFQPKGNYTPTGTAYTKLESDERYVQNMQRGAGTSPGKVNEYGPGEAPTGCVLTRAWHDSGTSYGVLFTYRPLQIYINGAWRTITG
ncbi:hypothetical protein U4W25_06160 [Citrobacter amalonaticus]|uniref:hypothetical protein n=1 Tax=Citrobacter amalonaticus TaxID=35703 RepID=UPI003093D737|nr:hypothetical protein U4W25_06160 [Citrobacter amalonaticus]